MHLAHPEYRMRGAALDGGAVDMAGLASSTVIELAMAPSVRPQPTTSAIVSSFMQFCRETQ